MIMKPIGILAEMDALASPDDVAKVIAFMASDEARVLRGSVRTA